MKHKIILIILFGTIFTTLIYFNTKNENKSYLALGDGISTGMTPYHIEGYNYNDYLVENLKNQNKIHNYYKKYNEVDETTKSLLHKLDTNKKIAENNITINQAIKKSLIITISLGMDELNNFASKNILTNSYIKNYIENYEQIIKKIKKISSGKIYIIGLYKTNFLSETKLEYANQLLKELANKENISFIDIKEITNYPKYFNINKNYYPNYKGQYYIYEKILKTIN